MQRRWPETWGTAHSDPDKTTGHIKTLDVDTEPTSSRVIYETSILHILEPLGLSPLTLSSENCWQTVLVSAESFLDRPPVVTSPVVWQSGSRVIRSAESRSWLRRETFGWDCHFPEGTLQSWNPYLKTLVTCPIGVPSGLDTNSWGLTYLLSFRKISHWVYYRIRGQVLRAQSLVVSNL